MLHSLPLVMLVSQSDFQGTTRVLYCTLEAISSRSDLQHKHISAYFCQHHKSHVVPHLPTPDHTSICRVCTHNIHTGHRSEQLGNWATAMQYCIAYVPYDTHFTLSMIRTSSRLHQWNISVPPPDECIHAILHWHMICIYIGRTHLALIQRLRKHITTALVGSEDCHFHELLRTTNIAEWYIVPLELVWGNVAAAIAKRRWWDKYRRWAINDLLPAVPHADGKPCKKVPRRAIQVLRSLCAAKVDNDYARAAAL